MRRQENKNFTITHLLHFYFHIHPCCTTNNLTGKSHDAIYFGEGSCNKKLFVQPTSSHMAAERPPTVRKAKANERIAVLKDDCFTRARKRRRVGLRSSRNFVELDEDEEDDDDEKDNTPIVEDKSDGDYEDDTTPRKKKKLMREKSLREEDEKKIASQKHWLAEFEEVLPIVRNFPKSAEYRKFRALEPAQKQCGFSLSHSNFLVP